MTPCTYHPIKASIQKNFEYLSIDGHLNRKYIACKRCHYVISYEPSNRKYLSRHLEVHHGIKETCTTLAKVETPQTHTLKAKKVPLFPPLKTRPNLPKPLIPTPPSAEPTTGKTECLKLGSDNIEVIKSTFQDALKNLDYKTEEMKYPSSELGYATPKIN